MWKRIKTEVRHNQFLVSAVAVAIVMVVWVYGCDSKTTSPWNPSETVTRMELQTQVDTYNLQVAAAVKDLDKQDLFKQELVTVGVAIAEAGGINPAGVGIGVMLLGIAGLGIDNRKKNSLVVAWKNAALDNGIKEGKNGAPITDTATS